MTDDRHSVYIDREPLPVDHVLLFKAIPSVQNGGCRAFVWLPREEHVQDWTQSLPVAIMFHGGGWLMGSADMIPFNQVRYLLSHGVAVVSCEYRLLPHFPLKHIREDLLDAYIYVQDRINTDLLDAGAVLRIDGSRACVMGWSAGGSNALWLAQEVDRRNKRATEAPLPAIRAIITTYPLTKLDEQPGPRSNLAQYCAQDLTGRLTQAMESLHSSQPSASFKVHPIYIVQRHSAIDEGVLAKLEALKNAGTAVPSVSDPPPRVQMGIIVGAARSSATGLSLTIQSIMAQCLSAVLVDADPPFDPLDSPANIIGLGFPPTAVVVAQNDALIPTAHSREVFEKLQSSGVQSELLLCEGMQHGEAECLSGSAWQESWWSSALRPSLDFALKQLGL